MFLRQRELRNSTLRFCNDGKIPWIAFKEKKGHGRHCIIHVDNVIIIAK